MNNRQVAEAFARGATSGKGSNFFIDGDTLYSYGHHFAVARRTPRGFLLTSRGYSRSTARHISYARRALPAFTYAAAEGDAARLEWPRAAEVRARAAAAAKAEARRARLDAIRETREALRKAALPPAWAVEPVPAVESQEVA